MDLCVRKCVPKQHLKTEPEPHILQLSCFHRCTIKYLEALRFTGETIAQQSSEIRQYNSPHTHTHEEEDKGLLEKLHAIYEEHYGHSPPPTPRVPG